MKCKIVSLMLVVATLVLLSSVDVARAQRNGKTKFLRRPFQRHRLTQSAGRSDSAGTGRGLMKHFMMFKNMWQQPSSNVIIITRPTTTQNDDTTTTTNAPAGTGTANRALRRDINERHKDIINDNDDAEDDEDVEVIDSNANRNLKGVNDKISMGGMHSNSAGRKRKRNNKRNKKRRNSGNPQRKQHIDVEKILQREEERLKGLESRRNGGRRTTTVKPLESSKDGGNNFMRLINSFRIQPSVVY